MPFTTEWVGEAPNALLPEILYPLNLLLWSLAFHWLDNQITKDNPELEGADTSAFRKRVVMYVGYIVCIVLVFVEPILSIYLIGVATIALFIWTFIERKIEDMENDSPVYRS